MRVFNIYGKILKKHKANIIIYVVVFFVLTLMFINTNNTTSADFEERRVNVTVFNNDGETELIEGLTTYLEKYVFYKDVKEEDVEDALYYREIYMAITIPEGFTESFLNGEDIKFIVKSVPDATSNISVSQVINKYLNKVSLYNDNLDLSIQDIISSVNKDLENEVSAARSTNFVNSFEASKLFYNYLSYFLYITIISVVGIVMLRLRRDGIKQRMSASPYSNLRINLEVNLGHLIFTFILLGIMVLVSFIFYKEYMTSKNGMFFIINAICGAFTVVSFAYFISLLLKSENALSAAVNIISLGTAFLTGAFIPQSLLGGGMLTFAKILPNYYFINNNERISILTDFSWDGINKIVTNMIIQIVFAFVFIILSILLMKKQNRQES